MPIKRTPKPLPNSVVTTDAKIYAVPTTTVATPVSTFTPAKTLFMPVATKKQDGGLTTKRRVVCLGIDSSATGWAITAMSVEDESYYSWLYKSPYQGALRLYDMTTYIELQLKSIRMQTGGIERIVMEGYSFGSMNARELIGEIGGITKLGLLKAFGATKPLGYPYYVSPQGLKKFATGSGGSGVKKEQVMLQTYKKWGVEFNDNNLADSYVASRIARALYVGSSDLLTYEKEVLAKVQESSEWQMNQSKLEKTSLKS